MRGTIGGQTFTYGQPRRVRKVADAFGGGCDWFVTNHPMGTRAFSTWQEAIEYASARIYMVNGSAA